MPNDRCLSSVLLWRLISDDGFEDGEQFAHEGGEGNLLGFAEFEETVVETLEDRIVPAGDSLK